MKKFLKVLSIIMIIVNILILTVSILAIAKPEVIGEWIVGIYEDITSDLGHTVAGMYARLSLIASISACVSLVLSTALCGTDYYYICKHCGDVVDVETEDVNKDTLEEPMAKEKLTKEQKAAARAEKRAERKAKREAKKTVEAIAEVAVEETAVNAKNEKVRKAAEFLKKIQDRI